MSFGHRTCVSRYKQSSKTLPSALRTASIDSSFAMTHQSPTRNSMKTVAGEDHEAHQSVTPASMRKAEPGGSSPAPPLLPSSGVIQADVSAAAAAYAPSSASSAACQTRQSNQPSSTGECWRSAP